MTTNRRTQSFDYTEKLRQTGHGLGRPSRNFKFAFKPAAIILVLAVGLGLLLFRESTGAAGNMIGSNAGNYRKPLQDAYAKIVNRDFTAAASEASRVIRADPSNALAYQILGLADARRGLVEEAVASFRKACELDPNLALAWFNLGVVEESRGEFGHALAAYRKAADVEPSNRSYAGTADRIEKAILGNEDWNMRERDEEKELLDGMGALNRGGSDDLAYSESVFRNLVNERPYDVAAQNMLGLALARQGRLEEAEGIFLKAVVAEPGFSDAWYNLGIVHKAMGKLKDATDDFMKAQSTSSLKSLKEAASRELASISESADDTQAGGNRKQQDEGSESKSN